MPIRKPLPALAVLAALLALAPAGASAAQRPSPSGLCNININLAPALIEAGESASLFGRLSCATHAAQADHVVRLLQRTASAPGFTVVQSTTTDANGFYSFLTAGLQNNSAFYVRAHGAQSGSRSVKVSLHVTLNGPADGTQLFTGARNRVIFSGVVSPADQGALVVLQRQNALNGEEWHRIGLGFVGPGGAYSIIHRFLAPGDANIRVLVRSQRRNVPTPSPLLSYEISQAENPLLTIAASGDPITDGQSVTVKGVAAGADDQPVTLLARTAHQATFAPVAEAKTDAAGAYSFAPQSPIASTYYQVRAAGKVSAVLYEGVKDLLTASVLPATVQAGQTLTFSGTVAPNHAGHVIYLERQNSTGAEFHIVQVSLVGAGSAYSLTHTVYGSGAEIFRVRIPGGPENEGAASAPFTITVTPAPAALLKPEPHGNSTLPPEGQT